MVALEHSVAGPLCTRVLAELGADVVKVERPGGDFSRHWDRNAGGEGAQFWWLNRGKRSIEVDLKARGGRELLDRLLAKADILVQNLSPAAAERVGLGLESFERRFPRLIHCAITGYGAEGPLRDRKAYDMLVQAEAGIMSLTGTAERAMRVGVSICDVGTGIYAAVLVLAALRERDRTGVGSRLDVAMFDVALEFVGPMLVSFLNSGVVYPRLPDRHHAIAPYGAFRCRDGKALVIAIQQDGEWRRLCRQLLNDPSLAQDPRTVTNSARLANRELVDGLVAEAFLQIDFADAVGLMSRLGIAYGVVNDMSAVATHPVAKSRGAIDSVMSPTGQVHALSGLAGRLFGSAAPGARPPALGQHTEEILRELGSDWLFNADAQANAGAKDG